MTIVNDDVVIIEERTGAHGRRIGVARLNSEKTLNSLNLAMIRRLYPQLKRWAEDDGIAAVFLHGAGEKAFCAGGDVKQVCLAVRAHGIDDPTALDFFSEEYRLDHLIHRFPKPLVVWAGGIVMGGGVGLLCGASHRIVTDTTRLAMPEISIGLYPDVGGSWLLGRLGRPGLFLGMTGAHIQAADALRTGLATHVLVALERQAVIEGLASIVWSADHAEHRAQIDALLDRLPTPLLGEAMLDIHAHDIEQRCAAGDLATLYAQLTEPSPHAWLNKAATTLKAGSPTSAGLIYRQWRHGQHLSLADCFREELVLSVQCARHPDFIEGVRALLVDKDQQPQWQPATLAGVTEAWLDGHYRTPWTGAHPLADLV